MFCNDEVPILTFLVHTGVNPPEPVSGKARLRQPPGFFTCFCKKIRVCQSIENGYSKLKVLPITKNKALCDETNHLWYNSMMNFLKD
jgi:hypothetical protein